MMSFRFYVWANGVSTAVMALSCAFAFGLYCAGDRAQSGWIVLGLGLISVANAGMLLLTYRRTRRRFEQARGDAALPVWKPPGPRLDWDVSSRTP